MRIGHAILTALVALIVLVALIGPYLTPYDPIDVGPPSEQFLPPSSDHLFGTDQVGRDVFSRVVAGARPSLFVAAVSPAVQRIIDVTNSGFLLRPDA